jgi:nucleotidyltransferase substrate binding protein (TIGR01987 family)
LFWKTLKRLLAHEAIEANYPKEVLRKAYQVHWLDNEETWISMVEDRNLVVHTYDEEMAKEMYERIKRYLPVFRRTFEFLRTKVADILAEDNELSPE